MSKSKNNLTLRKTVEIFQLFKNIVLRNVHVKKVCMCTLKAHTIKDTMYQQRERKQLSHLEVTDTGSASVFSTFVNFLSNAVSAAWQHNLQP